MWPLGSRTSWVRSGCPSSGIGGQRDCSNSSGIHDADIRRGAIKITDRLWDLRILLRTAGSILNGGKAYTIPIPDHGTDIASTYLALWSGNGDAKTGSFLLAKVANRSITGVPHAENTGWRSWPLMAHSVARVWPTRDRASAWMLRDPGRWTGTSLMPFRSQNFKSPIVRRVSLNDLVPPSLLMYETTTVLSHIRGTTLDLSWGRNRVTLRNTASISNRFICWLACCGDHVPCSVREPSCAPHPWLEASVNKVISVSRALSETPCSTAGEAHQATWWRMVGVTEILSDLAPYLWRPPQDWAEA